MIVIAIIASPVTVPLMGIARKQRSVYEVVMVIGSKGDELESGLLCLIGLGMASAVIRTR